MAFAEDLGVFFDLGGFAVEAVFTVGGQPRAVAVIFEDPTQGVALQGSEVESDAPYLRAEEANLAGVGRGTAVTVRGEAHVVERVRRDGTGLALVFLS